MSYAGEYLTVRSRGSRRCGGIASWQWGVVFTFLARNGDCFTLYAKDVKKARISGHVKDYGRHRGRSQKSDVRGQLLGWVLVCKYACGRAISGVRYTLWRV